MQEKFQARTKSSISNKRTASHHHLSRFRKLKSKNLEPRLLTNAQRSFLLAQKVKFQTKALLLLITTFADFRMINSKKIKFLNFFLIEKHCKWWDASLFCHFLHPLPHLSCGMLWVRALSEALYPILFRPQRQWYSSGAAPNSNTYITYPGVAPGHHTSLIMIYCI